MEEKVGRFLGNDNCDKVDDEYRGWISHHHHRFSQRRCVRRSAADLFSAWLQEAADRVVSSSRVEYTVVDGVRDVLQFFEADQSKIKFLKEWKSS